MSAAVVMPIQSLKNDAKIEEIESDIESPTARGRANHVNGGTADLSCNETHAEQVHLEKRSTHSAEPGPENTAPDGAGEVSGGAQQAVIIDDPPVETAVLEGTEQERYEAAKQIAESQGKLLRQACSDGDIDGILRLIDNKADVNSSNSSGTPPLHEAAHKGNPDATLPCALPHYRLRVMTTIKSVVTGDMVVCVGRPPAGTWCRRRPNGRLGIHRATFCCSNRKRGVLSYTIGSWCRCGLCPA
eukprot:GEMP01039112.1.p1 GENE.GEMP01039112.1~~GEMP01039112.1.p1  ORF type:complete len:244 (+),score=46.82 GEMP01039112.1:272-1003(+)